MKLPFSLQMERRTEETPRWLPVVTSLGAVVLAFLFSAVVLAVMGADPWRIYQYFFKAAFGSWGALSDVIVKATPLLLIGLGCSLAFRMHLWNIGAEGQFYIGAFMASLVVLVPLVPLDTTPKAVVLALMALLGMIGGALYGFIPGVLKAKFQINEVARIFRIQTHMVGDLEKSSFSNIEQQSLEFVMYTLDPWVVRWEQEIQRALFSESEKRQYFVKFNVDGLLRGDYGSRMNGYAVGRQNGWLSANDIRELEDMNRVPVELGGDLYLINGNMTKLADAGLFAKNNINQKEGSK